jgi:CheY-like chemotaxis protein
MRIGLIADVRGLLAPLRHALRLVEETGCDRLACLGSTVEGGPDDEAVLEELRRAGAVIVPSPHDAASLSDLAPEQELSGLKLAHEIPGGSDDVLWLTGVAAPTLLRARDILGTGERRACGDLYGPMAYGMAPAGPWRRTLLGPECVPLGEGPWLLCPGSVAMSETSRYGGSVMVVDEDAAEATVVTFGPDGKKLSHRKPRILVYCDDFDRHRPEADVLESVDFFERMTANEIVAEVAEIQPDVILLDYHLEGSMSGIDALLALRKGLDALPAPVLAIAGDPADSMGMKAAGAIAGLPFIYLKDVLTRTIHELAG